MGKKKLLVILAVVIFVAIAIGVIWLLSNKPDNDPDKQGIFHKHTYSVEWESDDHSHWHKATCGHNVIADRAEHTFVHGFCSICNRPQPQKEVYSVKLLYKGSLSTFHSGSNGAEIFGVDPDVFDISVVDNTGRYDGVGLLSEGCFSLPPWQTISLKISIKGSYTISAIEVTLAQHHTLDLTFLQVTLPEADSDNIVVGDNGRYDISAQSCALSNTNNGAAELYIQAITVYYLTA